MKRINVRASLPFTGLMWTMQSLTARAQRGGLEQVLVATLVYRQLGLPEMQTGRGKDVHAAWRKEFKNIFP